MSQWEVVIGLEIHAQLRTSSKIFSPDSAEFGAGDNSSVHPVSLGLPGALPVLNKSVVDYAVSAGLALNCDIQRKSVFARKNYFYPDMPKGYQISQFDKPICKNGHVEFYIDGELKKIRIERIHMEEDAGKSTHFGNYTLVNLNRAGVPLLEIVSEPDMRSAQEAAEYSRSVRQILRYIGACDGNLEEGSLRVDCNISIRRPGDELGKKVELKNLNSFRFIEKAVEYEAQRQIDCLESGQEIVQETRLYDSVKNITQSMRTKEDAHDYRYFPEPDLQVCEVSEQQLQQAKSNLPELPMQRFRRYQDNFGIPTDDAMILISEKELSEYFEDVVSHCDDPRQACNWVRGDLLAWLKDHQISILKPDVVSAKNLGRMICLIKDGTLSGKLAKQVFREMCESGKDPESIVEEKGYQQITDSSEISNLVDEILDANEDQVTQYLSGKDKVFGFFVGQVMKKTSGQASPDVVNAILKEQLKKRSES